MELFLWLTTMTTAGLESNLVACKHTTREMTHWFQKKTRLTPGEPGGDMLRKGWRFQRTTVITAKWILGV